ncbi:MAG: Tim44 domain-containing protein [Rhodospirillales bacterium]|nr:Tim44 domain-containing protein [Rhodospirillales bacterium]
MVRLAGLPHCNICLAPRQQAPGPISPPWLASRGTLRQSKHELRITVAANALQSLGGFPVVLVIFAGIALFLVLRLRSVLGKRVGFEKPPLNPGAAPSFQPGPVIEGRVSPASAPGRSIPDPQSALGQRLMQIVNRDPQFDPPEFLTQAEVSFRRIVTAFSAGDRATLQSLLTPHVYQTFEAAISARGGTAEQSRTEIKSILSAEIEDAEISGDLAAVIVRIISAQSTQTLDPAGNPTPGGNEQADLCDIWTFERDLRGKDPAWRLSAARSG